MADQKQSEDVAVTTGPDEMHLGVNYLREDFKDLRQEIRQELRDLRSSMDGPRSNLERKMDSRFFWTLGFMTTLTAFVAALIKL